MASTELCGPRIALLASGDRTSGGGGSTAERVALDVLERKVALSIGVVICNNPEGTVAVYDKINALNRRFGLRGDNRIDVVTINGNTHPEGKQERGQTLGESAAICRLLEERDIYFAAMVGYMKKLNGEFVEEWGWKPEYGFGDSLHNGIYNSKARISNNHPAILPFTADTHGEHSHERAVELFKQGKIKRTALTIHLASTSLDTGPVLFEEPVEIFGTDDADSLGARVQKVEKDNTSLVIARHVALRQEHLRAA